MILKKLHSTDCALFFVFWQPGILQAEPEVSSVAAGELVEPTKNEELLEPQDARELEKPRKARPRDLLEPQEATELEEPRKTRPGDLLEPQETKELVEPRVTQRTSRRKRGTTDNASRNWRIKKIKRKR